MATRERRQVGLVVGSQLVSSAGNFAFAAVLARRSTAADFGRLSLLLLVLYLGADLVRSLTAETLFNRESGSRGHTLAAARASFFLGVALAGLLLPVAWAAWPAGRPLLTAVGVTFPLLGAFDTAKLSYIRDGQAGHAALMDLIWTATFGIGIFVLPATTGYAFLAWLLPVALLGSVAAFRSRGGMAMHAWWKDVRSQGAGLAGDLFVGRGVVTAALVGVGLVASPDAIGAIRGAEMLFAPFIVMATGVRRGVLAVDARSQRPFPQMMRSVYRWSGVTAGAIVLCGVALVTVGEPIGEQLLGDTWYGARSVVVIAAVSAAASNTLVLARGPFQVARAISTYLRFRLVAVPFLVLPPVVLAAAYDAVGGQAGLTVGRVVSVALLAVAARDVNRRFGGVRTN